MIGTRLKLAIRNLLKDRFTGILVIAGFSIGFTAFILIGLFYMAEHRINAGFENAENIYRIYDPKKNTFDMDYDLYSVLMNEFPEVENGCPMEYYRDFDLTIKSAESEASIQITQAIATNGDFFDVFSVEIVESLSDKPFSDKNSIVISQSVAQKLYGDVSPLGKELITDAFEGTITAVINNLPNTTTFNAELIINTDNEDYRSKACPNGDCRFVSQQFIELNPKTDVTALSDKMNQSIHNLNTNTDSLAFQNLREIYLSSLSFYDPHIKGNSKMLLIFLAIGLLIIVLSSINYLNFTVSKQYYKLKEIGVYKTNGANTLNLFSLSLTEVSMGVIISTLIAIGLTHILLPSSNILFGRSIHFSDVNTQVAILLLLGIVIFVVLINSLAPVYIIKKFKITDFLNKGIKQTGKQTGKQVMLTLQLITSIALIAIVLFIYKQIAFVKQHDLGFDEEHLIRIDFPYFCESPLAVKEEIGKLPFVKGSTFSDGSPGEVIMSMGSGIADNDFWIECIRVSDDYLQTMGITLLEGRNFHLGDENKACLMNQAAIKKFGWENYENKEYKQGENYKVIGVVKNFNVESLHSEIKPVALLYEPDYHFGSFSVRLMPGNISQQLSDIEQAWKQLLPHEPLYFDFYDQYFQKLYEQDERLAKSISFFAIITVVLTCMGLLGQILLYSFTRTKEIGIRKVNGAKVSEVMSMLNKDFVKKVAIAFAIATPIAYYTMLKWLENFAYKTTLNWWVFTLAGLLTLGIVLLTISWQNWRTAVRNPVETLKYE